jgi:ABC-type transport system involved in multi-copper enzyme maturation permease subunit
MSDEGTIMLALLKKDWRTYRSAVVGSIALLCCACIMGVAVYRVNGEITRDALSVALGATGVCGLMLSGVVAAILGGLAFAGERRDHSADFLAMLPVSRAQIVWSKIIVSAAWLAVMVLINLIFIGAAYYVQENPGPIPWRQAPDIIATFGVGAAIAMMLFGVGWLLSSFSTSPAISASVSIGVMAASLTVIAMNFERPIFGQGLVLLVSFLWAMFVGITAFTLGTKHYLRRIEP